MLQSVGTNLDVFQAMGIQGVTVAVQYPLLTPSFPNYTQYLAFYEQVASMVHQRGMKLDVEAHVLFANSPFSSVKYNFSSVPYSQYVTAQARMDQTIIDDLHPEWIDLGVEPDTQYLITGYPQVSTPAGWTSFIESLAGSINKSTTKLVAGAAAWDGVRWLTGFVSDPRIDAISTHVYPLYGMNFANLLAIGQAAQQAHKELVVDEVWETKSVGQEGGSGGVAADAAIFQRDVYGFWSPLDQQFIKEVVRFSEIYPVSYLSPYWSTYFFGCLNYDPSIDALPYNQVVSMENHAASQGMLNNMLTPTGAFYSQLIQSNGQ